MVCQITHTYTPVDPWLALVRACTQYGELESAIQASIWKVYDVYRDRASYVESSGLSDEAKENLQIAFERHMVIPDLLSMIEGMLCQRGTSLSLKCLLGALSRMLAGAHQRDMGMITTGVIGFVLLRETNNIIGMKPVHGESIGIEELI